MDFETAKEIYISLKGSKRGQRIHIYGKGFSVRDLHIGEKFWARNSTRLIKAGFTNGPCVLRRRRDGWHLEAELQKPGRLSEEDSWKVTRIALL